MCVLSEEDKSSSINFLEIKAINDECYELRDELRCSLKLYRSFDKAELGLNFKIKRLWKDYRQLMAESHRMTTLYIKQFQNKSSYPTRKIDRVAA